MNTWTPLWSQVVESTLWEEPLEVRVLFLTMLAIKDPDHVVRMPLRRLCKKANMKPEVLDGALKVLLNPDSKSSEPQDYEGRRIEVVEGGWLVLNGEHYRQEMAKLMRRFYKANWARNSRAAKKGSTAAGRLYEKAEKNGDSSTTEALERMAGVAAAAAALPEARTQKGISDPAPCPEPVAVPAPAPGLPPRTPADEAGERSRPEPDDTPGFPEDEAED